MRNIYKIIDYTQSGLPCIEVLGEEYHYQDLYDLVGKNQYMTTFDLKEGSSSAIEFGSSVLGVIFYDRKSIDSLESSKNSGQEIKKKRIRIESPSRDLSNKKKGDLKYRGINVEDIKSISFLPYSRETERHETGEKKVPDVVEVEVDFREVDTDLLNQNYLVKKHNSGTVLAPYEKEQLIGIILGLNNGRIDIRIANQFGFSKDDLETNLNIGLNFYRVKEKRHELTSDEEKYYSDIKSTLSIQKITKVAKELTDNGITNRLAEEDSEVIKSLFKAVEQFSPSILHDGKQQVYWDLDSYIHIALRHIKDYQLGHFSEKTPFSYLEKDLKMLIQKVLSKVKSEIDEYFSQQRTDDFSRHGKMAISYNGDHYHVRISPNGLLVQFHPATRI